jgi:putative transposase
MDHDFTHTFFVTSVTHGRRPVFLTEPNSRLFLTTLFGLREKGHFSLHEFVVMPDHVHFLLTPNAPLSLAQAIELIRGRYSNEFVREFASKMEIWERSFTHHRIRDCDDYEKHRRLIFLNPVHAGLAESPQDYPCCSAYPGFELDAAPKRLTPVAAATFNRNQGTLAGNPSSPKLGSPS